jgi:hypothetical protein
VPPCGCVMHASRVCAFTCNPQKCAMRVSGCLPGVALPCSNPHALPCPNLDLHSEARHIRPTYHPSHIAHFCGLHVNFALSSLFHM